MLTMLMEDEQEDRGQTTETRPANYTERIKAVNIRAIVTDVDGVLTDGGYMHIPFPGGEVMIAKTFNTRDAAACNVWRERGKNLFIITTADDDVTKYRCQRISHDAFRYGMKDKADEFWKLSAEWGIPLNEMAYIGDDSLDVPAMMIAGYTACPADACAEIKQMSDYICMRKGGEGALAELIEYIIYFMPRG